MPHWVPSWQLAMTVAGSLAVAAVAVRTWLRIRRSRGDDPRPKTAVAALIAWEVAIIIGLYGLWQFTGAHALVGDAQGLERGRHLWNLERDWHLPSEATFQSWFLPHPWIIKALNFYYVIAHYNVLLIMLAWLFWRHRDRYREARTTIGLTTFACLAVQMIPVAPPRLIGGHGIVDTAIKYGQSVYGPVGQGFSDQYSAMPSVHIAWSSAVAFFVWRSTTSKWRWLGVGHAVLTWIVVVATGNHFWLDGVVAILLLAASFWTVRLASFLVGRVSEWITWTPAGRSARAGLAARSPALSSFFSPPAEVAVASPAAKAPEPAGASPPSR